MNAQVDEKPSGSTAHNRVGAVAASGNRVSRAYVLNALALVALVVILVWWLA